MARDTRRLKSAAKISILLAVALTVQSAFAQESSQPYQKEGAKKQREKIVDMSVLFKYEADKEGFLAKALFGLFKLEKEEHKYSRLAVRPFFYRESDYEHENYDTTLFYGLGAWRRERETLTSWAIPFYYLSHSPERTTVLAPFVWTDCGKDFSTYLFYPFFGYSESPQREKYYFAFPFFSYTHYESGRKVLDAPLPLVKYSSGPEGCWFHIFPFLWYDAYPDSHGTFILFPVFWDFSSKETHFTTLFPLYWDSASGDSSFFMLFPFYAHGREGEFTSRTVIFPFYWNFSSPDSSLFMILPFYGYYKSQDTSRVMLGFPLFSYTDRRLPEHRELGFCDWQLDLAWPVFMVRNAPDLFHFRLFPFYYGKNYDLTESGTRAKAVSDYFYIVPLLWWGSAGTDESVSRRLYLIPFLWFYDTPEKKLFHLWPLFGQLKFKDRNESEYYLAYPLVSIHTNEKQGLFEVDIPAGLALFKYETINATVLPLQLTGKQREIRLFPVFSLSTRPGKFQFLSLPVSYREQIDASREKYSYLNVLLWSFFGEWSKDESYWRLFYALAHYERSKEGTAFYIFDMEPLFDWQWFSYENKKEEGKLELTPLFKYKSEKDDYEFNTIFGLFGWGRKKGDTYLKLFWFLKPKL